MGKRYLVRTLSGKFTFARRVLGGWVNDHSLPVAVAEWAEIE